MYFRFIAVVALILVVCGMVYAQDTPKVEVGIGYMYARQGLEEFSPIGIDHVSLNGWNASVTANFNKWFGIEGDVSGAYGGPRIDLAQFGTPGSVKINENIYTYMFGPRLAYRKREKVVPFAHVLFGGAHAKVGADVNDNGIPGTVGEVSDTSFTWAAGGGVDFPLSKKFAIRSQLDYLSTKFADVKNSHQNSFRAIGGIVFRF